MSFVTARLFVATLVLFAATPAIAQQSHNSGDEHQLEQIYREISEMPWKENGTGSVGGVASIEASKQARVLSGEAVARFIQLSGNLPHPGATIVAPEDLRWFSLYDYRDVGYVTDKDSIDAGALMKSLREDQDTANAERRQQGLPELNIVDWAVQPHYDPTTHNLEWGLKIRSSDGENLINYTTRHLGRGGFVSSVLVSSPETFQSDLAEFRVSDSKLAFDPGSTYAEFRDGDKIAGYGLAALIAGGAGAAAVKSGAAKGFLASLAALWKIIAIGIVAALAAGARFLRRIFSRMQEE